ncbi:helix-turn-helix transcriptional regulator [Psychromonas ossibalaenae]|uniref:helix-turn-helix transcriptional regulator n=1 Tax=Psychromonas ossibalaenae TaxID=444922 RepID=UPI00037406FE|nr:helix-turn-helix transcriptional regulator [Psychromonas ossibalaenae]
MKDKQGKDISFEQSSKVCFRQKSLNGGLAWAHYQNDHERLFYANDKQHTLSMYLSGGFETHRTDIRSGYGAPGRFCLMPKDSESHWQLGRPQQFMHLYFDDNYLKQLALKTFDIDPRRLSLPELTFAENSGLESMFRHQMVNSDWCDTNNHMLMEQVTNTILVTMLQNLGAAKFTDTVKGGLAPTVLAQVCDYIHTYSHRQIFLAELAAAAQLSEYHFCRMFKENMAQTPQEYITTVRIKQVKLLASTTRLSLADIALQCGFSNQSHMGRCFKKLLGITPKQYRNHLSG